MRAILLDGGSVHVVAAMFADTDLALAELLKPTVFVLSSLCSREQQYMLEKACPSLPIVAISADVNRTAVERCMWITGWLGSQNPHPTYLVIDSCEAAGNHLPTGHFIYSRGPRVSSPNAFAGRLLDYFNKLPSPTPPSGQKELEEGVILDGVVKRFNPSKGFGFITSATVDVFVHQSSIQGDGFRGLNTGARVKFTVKRDDNGRQVAASVFQRTPYVPSNLESRPVEGGIRPSKKSETAVSTPQVARQRDASPRRKPIRAPTDPRRTRLPQFSFLAHDGTVYFSSAMSASAAPYSAQPTPTKIESTSSAGRPLTDN